MLFIRQIFIALISILYFFGCATMSQQQIEEYQETIPYCIENVDCKEKWAAAKQWLLDNARMKIQIYSDDLIETYNPPPNSPNLAARIRKQPAGKYTYSITANVWCSNLIGCVPNRIDALLDFNKYLNNVVVVNDSLYPNMLRDTNYSKLLMGIGYRIINSKFIITQVYSGSPADKAGLKVSDKIISMSGKKIIFDEDISEIFERSSFGDEIEIIVKRDDELHPLTLKFLSESELQNIKEANEIKPTKSKENNMVNIEEKIKTLKKLLDNQLITQEEFDNKKKTLLEKF